MLTLLIPFHVQVIFYLIFFIYRICYFIFTGLSPIRIDDGAVFRRLAAFDTDDSDDAQDEKDTYYRANDGTYDEASITENINT